MIAWPRSRRTESHAVAERRGLRGRRAGGPRGAGAVRRPWSRSNRSSRRSLRSRPRRIPCP